MEDKKQKSSLLVDGEVLKQHILSMGKCHDAQTVKLFLAHMVSEIQQQFPNTEVCVHYFGVRGAEDAICPVSGEPYKDIDIKQSMVSSQLPNAELKTSWAKMCYPHQTPWILKPESWNKTKLTDGDFVLNEQPKGLLTRLVDTMAEKAVSRRDSRLFVYGDIDDMSYSVATTNGMGMPVHEVTLEGNRPHISEVMAMGEPKICNRQILDEVSETLRQPWAKNETFINVLGWLRGALSDQDKGSVLMLDVGVLRKYLVRRGIRTSVQNMSSLLQQIKESLPEKVSKTIFYHAKVAGEEAYQGAPLSQDETSIESQLLKNESLLPGVDLSLGKIQRNKRFPTLLKQKKWFVDPMARLKEDFTENLRQYDVDDRIAYDMALARINPMIKQVYLLSTDGDFAYSVEQAKRAELPVSLVRLEEGTKSLSKRLETAVDEVMYVPIDMSRLISRQDEREAVHQKNEEEKRARLRQIQQQKRESARLEAEDEEEEYAGFVPRGPSKEDRWGKKCVAHKKKALRIIAKSRGKYTK